MQIGSSLTEHGTLINLRPENPSPEFAHFRGLGASSVLAVEIRAGNARRMSNRRAVLRNSQLLCPLNMLPSIPRVSWYPDCEPH